MERPHSVLIPTRFLAVLGHFLAVLCALQENDGNIKTGLGAHLTDSSISEAERKLNVSLSVAIACFLFDFVGMFFGFSLFISEVRVSLYKCGTYERKSLSLTSGCFQCCVLTFPWMPLPCQNAWKPFVDLCTPDNVSCGRWSSFSSFYHQWVGLQINVVSGWELCHQFCCLFWFPACCWLWQITNNIYQVYCRFHQYSDCIAWGVHYFRDIRFEDKHVLRRVVWSLAWKMLSRTRWPWMCDPLIPYSELEG